MVPNRRRHTRQLVTPPVYVAVDGARNGGVLYDVAEGGLAVDLRDPRIAGDPLHLEFDIPETGRHFSAFARVTWANEPGNRVGVRFIDLSQASDLQLKEWIWTKSIAPDGAHVPGIPVVDAAPVLDPVPQPLRTPEPIASHWFKPIADPPPPPAPLFSFPSATILRELAPLAASTPQPLALPTVKPTEDPKPKEAPAAAEGASASKEAPKIAGVLPDNDTVIPAGVTAAKDDGSRIVHDLRSTLSQTKTAPLPEPREAIASAPGALDLRRRRRKVLLTALVLVDLLLLAVAVSVYTSEDWRAGLVVDDLKSRMVSAFSLSTAIAPPRSVPARAPEPKAAIKHAPAQLTTRETPTPVPVAALQPQPASAIPAVTQYDVMDAQNGHHLMGTGHTSTGITVRYERSAQPEGQNSSATQPQSGGATAPEANSDPLPDPTGAGHVSQQSSGERPTVQVMPDYPALALQQNIQGKVVLQAIIAKDGTLRDVHLISAPSLLNSAVLNAVKKWRYQPHYQNGEPVEVDTQIVVNFSITAK
jgi:TonB family protein